MYMYIKYVPTVNSDLNSLAVNWWEKQDQYEPRELKAIIKPLLILFCKVHWMFLQGAGQAADKNYCKYM